MASSDPILERRRRVARVAELGQRIGYVLYAVASVAFVVGFVVGFSDGYARVTIGALLLGSVVLAPAIIASYAVRAADRADRDDDW